MSDPTWDLPVGVRSRSAGRTLTRGELQLMAELTTHWHAPSDASDPDIVGGPIVATVVATLASNTAPLHHELGSVHGVRTVAALGIEAVFHTDVRAGDTLWAETWVESVRQSSSHPGRHVLTIGDQGLNQRGQVVVDLRRPLLVELGQ